MMKLLRITAFAALLPLLFLSCAKKEEAKPEEAPKAVQPAKKAAEDAVKPVEPEGTEKPPEKTRFRDPFLSKVLVEKAAEAGRKTKGPLECCELNAFRLMAAVVSKDKSYALLLAPDTKRYIVKKGDAIGTREGRVIKIEPSSITVREIERDTRGEVISTPETELRLPDKGAEAR